MNSEVPLLLLFIIFLIALPSAFVALVFSPVVAFFLIIALAVVFSLLRVIVASPAFRGWWGEAQVRLWMRVLLGKKRYHHLDDVILPVGEGTTQIDHVLVSPFGVFVIETKNYGGAVYGSERDRTWTQKIGRQTNKIQNPIHQNYGHRCGVEGLLGLAPGETIGIVVFARPGVFRSTFPPGVCECGGLFRLIRAHREKRYAPEQVAAMVARIEAARIPSTRKTRRQHRDYVRGKHGG